MTIAPRASLVVVCYGSCGGAPRGGPALSWLAVVGGARPTTSSTLRLLMMPRRAVVCGRRASESSRRSTAATAIPTWVRARGGTGGERGMKTPTAGSGPAPPFPGSSPACRLGWAELSCCRAELLPRERLQHRAYPLPQFSRYIGQSPLPCPCLACELCSFSAANRVPCPGVSAISGALYGIVWTDYYSLGAATLHCRAWPPVVSPLHRFTKAIALKPDVSDPSSSLSSLLRHALVPQGRKIATA